jgi:hypothetical protein
MTQCLPKGIREATILPVPDAYYSLVSVEGFFRYKSEGLCSLVSISEGVTCLKSNLTALIIHGLVEL